MTELQPFDLEAIEARAAAASSGPWGTVVAPGIGSVILGRTVDMGTGKAIAVFGFTVDNMEANATFCEHAREDIPALAEEIRSLHAQIENAEAVINDAFTWYLDLFAMGERNPRLGQILARGMTISDEARANMERAGIIPYSDGHVAQ